MSIYTKILSTLGVASMVITGSVIGSAQTTGTLTAPLSNSSFTYCNFNNFMATSDVEAARQITGASAYFYVTENTSLNVVNGKCVNNLVANYVPYISGHKTSFDINAFASVSNVKVLNSNPEIMSVTCDGNDTVMKFMDVNQDVLKYNTIVGANDFDTPTTSNESNNVLKVTLKRKDSAFTGSNNVTVYVDEVAPTGLAAGSKAMMPSMVDSATNAVSSANAVVSSANASSAPAPVSATNAVSSANGALSSANAMTAVRYTPVEVTMDKTATTSKLSLTVKGVCDASLYTTSSSMVSSSSMMSSMNSSMMMSSSSMMMSSNAMTTVVGAGKGVLTRTGGSN